MKDLFRHTNNTKLHGFRIRNRWQLINQIGKSKAHATPMAHAMRKARQKAINQSMTHVTNKAK